MMTTTSAPRGRKGSTQTRDRDRTGTRPSTETGGDSDVYDGTGTFVHSVSSLSPSPSLVEDMRTSTGTHVPRPSSSASGTVPALANTSTHHFHPHAHPRQQQQRPSNTSLHPAPSPAPAHTSAPGSSGSALKDRDKDRDSKVQTQAREPPRSREVQAQPQAVLKASSTDSSEGTHLGTASGDNYTSAAAAAATHHVTNTNTSNIDTYATVSPTSLAECTQFLTSVSVSPANFKLLHEETIIANFRILLHLLTCSRENLRKFSSTERCDVVTKVFKRYAQLSPAITSEVLNMVALLCKDVFNEDAIAVHASEASCVHAENVKTLGVNGFLPDLTSTLSRFSKWDNGSLCRTCFSIIASLATNPHNSLALARDQAPESGPGICELLPDLLTQYISQTDTVREGLLAMITLAYNSNNASRLANAGHAGVVLATALYYHRGSVLGTPVLNNGTHGTQDPTVLIQWACLAIVNLAAEDAGTRALLGRQGVCDVLLHVLCTASSSTCTSTCTSTVVQYACMAVSALCTHNNDNKILFDKEIPASVSTPVHVHTVSSTVGSTVSTHVQPVTNICCALVRALLHNSHNSIVLHQVFACIATLLDDDDDDDLTHVTDTVSKTLEKFSGFDISKEICHILKEHIMEPAIVETALKTVKILITCNGTQTCNSNSTRTKICLQLTELGMYNIVTQFLNFNNDSSELVLVCLQVFTALTPSPSQDPDPDLINTLHKILQKYGSNNNNTNMDIKNKIVENVLRIFGHLGTVRAYSTSTNGTQLSKPLSSELGEVGLCQTIVTTVEKYLSTVQVLSAGCEAMARMALREDSRAALGMAKGCYVVTQVLGLYANANDRDRRTVLVAALRAVTSLAGGVGGGRAAYCTSTVRSTGTSTVGNIITGTVGNISTTSTVGNTNNTSTVGNTRTSTVSHANRALFGVEGACDVLTAVLKTHVSTSAEVVAACTDAIASMVQGNDETNVFQLLQAGICDVLVQAVLVHAADAAVCIRVLRCVYLLCMHDHCTSSGNGKPLHAIKMRFNDARICSALLMVLKLHTQLHTMLTVRAQKINNNNNPKPSSSSSPSSLSSSSSQLIALMPWIYRVLGILCTVSEIRSKITSNENIVHLLISSLQLPDALASTHVVHAGMLTVANIAYDKDKTCASITNTCVNNNNNNTCDLVVQALKRHFADPYVTTQCLCALKNLCTVSGDDNLLRFHEAGVCPIVIRVLRTHMEEVNVVKEVFIVMANLAVLERNRVALGSAGACSLVVEAFRGYLSNKGLALEGAGCICNLAYNNVENRKKFVICQALDVLRNFQQCYINSEEHGEKYTLAYNSISPVTTVYSTH